MRDISEVLQQKLAQIERVKHEISVLREAIPLLLDAPDTTAEMIAQFRTTYKNTTNGRGTQRRRAEDPVELFPEHFERTAHGLERKPHLAGESAFAEGPDKTDFTGEKSFWERSIDFDRAHGVLGLGGIQGRVRGGAAS